MRSFRNLDLFEPISWILYRCATRLNFMGSTDILAKSFHETFELINLDRFVEHARKCPDPTCGVVWCIDGTCKVFREICGEPLPMPSDPEYVPDESDVQNAMNRGYLRQKVCDNLPGRKNARCESCLARLAAEEDENCEHNVAQEGDNCPTVTGTSSQPVRKSRRLASQAEKDRDDDSDQDDELVWSAVSACFMPRIVMTIHHVYALLFVTFRQLLCAD